MRVHYLMYLLEASGCMAAFFCLYRLLLHREMFFIFNRAFILGGVGLSLALPLVDIPAPFLKASVPPGPAVMLSLSPEIPLPEVSARVSRDAPVADYFSWREIIWGIYLAGAVLLLGQLLLRLWKLYRLIGSLPAEPGDGYNLVKTGGNLPTFSFFHWLFWNDSQPLSAEETQQVMRHELTHIRQWHTLDVLFLEVVSIACWFNPSVYLFSRHLKTVHEYLADREASEGGSSPAYLQLVATQLLHNINPALVQPFNQSQLKNRMKMLKALSHTRPSLWKIGVSLTAVTVFSFLYACRSAEMAEPNGHRKMADAQHQEIPNGRVLITGTINADGNPLAGAIVIVKGTNAGTTTDQAGKYSIEATPNSTLVYSFVGYQTEQIAVGKETALNVQLMKNFHALPEVKAKADNKTDPNRPKLYENSFESQRNNDRKAADGAVFQVVEQMPEFPGGTNGLRWFFEDYLQYPTQAREKKVEGAVFVAFTIQADGAVTNATVLRGLGFGCDEEALRVVQKMPKWLPGKQNGQLVAVNYSLPVRFEL